MNIGMIGKGNWGNKLYNKFDKIANIKTCSKRKYEDEILIDKSIDAVVIATPIDTLYQIVSDSLNAGKHVFVEKPMAFTSSELNDIISLKEDKVLFGGYVHLYNPVYNALKKIVLVDPIKRIDMFWEKMGTFDNDIYLNLVSHELSILFGLVDSKLVGFSHQKEGVITNIDKVNFVLKFKNGIVGSINVNRSHPFKSKFIKITTQSNKIYYWVDDKLLVLNRENQRYDTIFKNNQDTLLIECTEFLNCIKKGREPLSNGKFGLKILNFIENLQ